MKQLLSKVFGFLFEDIVSVNVKDENGQWRVVKVKGPVLFSELDEQFGAGNWAL